MTAPSESWNERDGNKRYRIQPVSKRGKTKTRTTQTIQLFFSLYLFILVSMPAAIIILFFLLQVFFFFLLLFSFSTFGSCKHGYIYIRGQYGQGKTRKEKAILSNQQQHASRAFGFRGRIWRRKRERESALAMGSEAMEVVLSK